MRNTRVLTILTLAGCVVAACNAGELADSGPRDVEAILIFYGDTSRIIAPDTVVRGATFDVTFTTFAGGCRRRVAYDGVVTAPGILEIRPYVGEERHPGHRTRARRCIREREWSRRALASDLRAMKPRQRATAE